MGTKYEFQANTQYNDLRGTIAIDFPGPSFDLDDYASSLGIDLDLFDPQGIDIYRGENQQIDEITVTVVAIDRKLRDEYEKSNNGRVPIVEIHNADTFMNFMRRIHRMSIVALIGYKGDSNYHENFDFVDSKDLKEEE
jgi:hypothetical protein